MKGNQVQEEAKELLQSFEIENDKIICTDPSALQALIAYLKRLFQLFPEIKKLKTGFISVKQTRIVVSNRLNRAHLILNLVILMLEDF
jgi:hypothetical protein